LGKEKRVRRKGKWGGSVGGVSGGGGVGLMGKEEH